jgi:hypothetical protein
MRGRKERHSFCCSLHSVIPSLHTILLFTRSSSISPLFRVEVYNLFRYYFIGLFSGLSSFACACFVLRWSYFQFVRWGSWLRHCATSRKVAGSILDVIGFFSWPNPSSRTMAMESTQPLTEMSTRNFPGGKGSPARKADNLTAICEPIVQKMWKPRRLTILWASAACCRDSFTFVFYLYHSSYGLV